MTRRPSRLVMSGSGRGAEVLRRVFLGQGKRGLQGERLGFPF